MSIRIDPAERAKYELALLMAQASGKLPEGFPTSLQELERRVASGEVPQEALAAFTSARAAGRAFTERKMARQVAKLPDGASPEQEMEAQAKGLTKVVSRLLEGCANPGCSSGVRAVETLKKCARCKHVMYCGEPCQRAHWLEHKKVCRESN